MPTSAEALARASADPDFDFSAPTDSPAVSSSTCSSRAPCSSSAACRAAGVVSGNLLATSTLLALSAVAFVLVLVIVLWPLVRLGRPAVPPRAFAASLAYFSMIGLGFMFVQIPFLQRFSVYLGHPTYTFSIILFLMILAAGAGSFLSDRVALGGRWATRLPLVIAALVVIETALLQPVTDLTIGGGLLSRTLVVAVLVVPLALMLGMCFPIGLRLTGRHSDVITAWMWGVNGAAGVMASVVAVMASMWLGINVSLWIAAALYLALVIPMRWLGKVP